MTSYETSMFVAADRTNELAPHPGRVREVA